MAKRARRSEIEDEDDEDALPGNYVIPPEPWENDDCDAARAVRKILDVFEVKEIDTPTRFALHRIVYKCDRWLKLGIPGARPGLGQERVTFTLRCILETGNESALCLPVVQAVDGALRFGWEHKIAEALEVFDGIKLRETLETLRSLDLFDNERELTGALERILTRKLRRALTPRPPEPPKAPSKQERIAADKQARASATVRIVERKMDLGRKLAALRDATPNNREFGAAVRKQFDLHNSLEVAEMARVARRYGNRPEIFSKVGWRVLKELASSATSESERQKFEARILAGEIVRANEIAAARPRGRRGGRQKKPHGLTRISLTSSPSARSRPSGGLLPRRSVRAFASRAIAPHQRSFPP
jgi:hypothetical protein